MSSYLTNDALPFNPDLWGKDPVLVEFANCWQYVIGDIYFAQVQATGHSNPGALSGNELTKNTLHKVVDFCITDGLEHTGRKLEIKSGSYPIALFLCPGKDYHCARMNSDGTWSEKFAPQAPSLIKRGEDGPLRYDEVIHWYYPAQHLGSNTAYTFVAFFLVPRDLKLPKKPDDALAKAAKRDDKLIIAGRCISANTFLRKLRPHRYELSLKRNKGLVIIPMG